MIYFLLWHMQEPRCCTNWAINIVRSKCVEETEQGGDDFITNEWWMSLQKYGENLISATEIFYDITME